MTEINDSDITPSQMKLDLKVAAEREVEGVGMGVFDDGTPFLNLRGLSRMCGVDIAAIVRITAAWQDNPQKPREAKIKELIRAQGADDTIAFYAVEKNGQIQHLVPSTVCMAVLEYYAFEARTPSEQAAQSYRVLARKGFEDYVYAQVGYNPAGTSDIAWRQFHDRVSLNYDTVPNGYFSIFKEMADIIVTLIRSGARLDDKFIPDISLGQAWGKYWRDEQLDIIYGDRIKYTHNYPLYFPQAASNPQAPFCYPDEALAEFRKWVRKTYIPHKMPTYLNNKVKAGALPASDALAAIEALESRNAALPRPN